MLPENVFGSNRTSCVLIVYFLAVQTTAFTELLINDNGTIFNSTVPETYSSSSTSSSFTNDDADDQEEAVLPKPLPSPPIHYPEYSEFIDSYSEIDVEIRFTSNGTIIPELFPLVAVNRTVLIDAIVDRPHDFSILNFTWMIGENCFDTGRHSRFKYHFTMPNEYNIIVMVHGLNRSNNERHYFGLQSRILNVEPSDGQYRIDNVDHHRNNHRHLNPQQAQKDREEEAKIDAILASYRKHSMTKSGDPSVQHWTGFNLFLALMVMVMFSMVVVLFIFIVQYSDRYNRTRIRIRRLMQFYSLDGSGNSSVPSGPTGTNQPFCYEQSGINQNTLVQYFNHKSPPTSATGQAQPLPLSPSQSCPQQKLSSELSPQLQQQQQQQLKQKQIIDELLQDTIQSSYESAIVRIGQSVIRPQTLVKTSHNASSVGNQRDEYEHLSDFSDE